LALVRGQRGVGATEYVILFILAGLGAILLYGKYGRTVGGKVDVAGKRVETLGQEQAPGAGAGSNTGVGGGSGGGGAGSGSLGGTTGGSGPSSSTAEYSSPEVLPDRIDGGDKARTKKLDTRVAVILGIIVVAIGALMILAVARGLRKEEKARKAQKR
jgi:hypothetical protein